MKSKKKPTYQPTPINLIENDDPNLPKIFVRQFEMGEFIRCDVILNGYRPGIDKWPSGKGFTMTFLKVKK